MTKIKIGADELILWLRKNRIASNKQTDVLGRQIKQLIVQIEGADVEEEPNVASYWDCSDGACNIGELHLPKTASQYKIHIDNLPRLYSILQTWE
jgi:hypothetical protein